MNWLALTVLPLLTATLLGDGGLNRIHTANQAAVEAQAAYQRGHDEAAIRAWEQVKELGLLTEEGQLNLAHAYFRAGQASAARRAYAALTGSSLPYRRATVLNQLALLSAREANPDRALDLLRRALRADPGSAIVRANYEALLRYLAANPPERQPLPRLGRRPQPKSGQSPRSGQASENPDGANQAPQGADGRQSPTSQRPGEAGNEQRQQARGNQPGNVRGQSPGADPTGTAPGNRAGDGTDAADPRSATQTLRARPTANDLPLDQARMLLDAMRAAEEQYLQQHQPRATRRPTDRTKPDW